jgi:opacity protein-like surface antigen
MKRFLITLFIIYGIHSVVFAQTKKSFTLGFDIGATASNEIYPFKSAYVDESTAFGSSGPAPSILGLNVGISGDYYFSSRWSIKGALIYYQKGSGNIFLSRTATSGNPYHLNYLEVPLMAGFHFGAARNWYINWGIYGGFLSGTNQSANVDAKNAFTTTDYGLSAGIGIKFPLHNKMKLFIEYDGQLGFRDVLKNSPGDSPSNVSESINVGLNFAIK